MAASRLLVEAADPALAILITTKTAKNPMNLLDSDATGGQVPRNHNGAVPGVPVFALFAFWRGLGPCSVNCRKVPQFALIRIS